LQNFLCAVQKRRASAGGFKRIRLSRSKVLFIVFSAPLAAFEGSWHQREVKGIANSTLGCPNEPLNAALVFNPWPVVRIKF